MATTPVFTATDVISDLAEWMGQSSVQGRTLSHIKRAIETAYRDLPGAHTWPYFIGRFRFAASAHYNSGTLDYDQDTLTATLTGGTWPSWAALGTLKIGNNEYEVQSRTSDSAIVLSVNSNPGDDLAGQSYDIWRDSYPLPVDCQSLGSVRDIDGNYLLNRISPNDFIACRYNNNLPTMPDAFVVMRDANYIGAMGIYLFPPPATARTYEGMYKKRPRQLSTWQYTTGTISASGAAITGVGTTFTADMIGCVLRYGTAAAVPTGSNGENRYCEQRIITSFTDATHVGIDQAFDNGVSSLRYEISDPIELEAGSMYTAFLRRAEHELGVLTRRDDVGKLWSAYQDALTRAKEASQPSFDSGGRGRGYRRVPEYWTPVDYS